VLKTLVQNFNSLRLHILVKEGWPTLASRRGLSSRGGVLDGMSSFTSPSDLVYSVLAYLCRPLRLARNLMKLAWKSLYMEPVYAVKMAVAILAQAI